MRRSGKLISESFLVKYLTEVSRRRTSFSDDDDDDYDDDDDDDCFRLSRIQSHFNTHLLSQESVPYINNGENHGHYEENGLNVVFSHH